MWSLPDSITHTQFKSVHFPSKIIWTQFLAPTQIGFLSTLLQWLLLVLREFKASTRNQARCMKTNEGRLPINHSLYILPPSPITTEYSPPQQQRKQHDINSIPTLTARKSRMRTKQLTTAPPEQWNATQLRLVISNLATWLQRLHAAGQTHAIHPQRPTRRREMKVGLWSYITKL